jgi:hypothetical protein
MNLEQIVKETVAKFVAEKKGKDLTGDGKIDSADYLKARSNAIEKAKGLDEASIPSNVESLANKIISWYEKHPNPKMQADRLPAVEKNIEYLMSKTVGNNAWDFKTFEKAVKEKYSLVFKESQEINEDHEDHEVSMAQSSLNSILRSAMELKAKIGNQEINIPAWIQDHITNSENFIDQASQGYHEYSNGGEHGEMDEANLGHNEISKIEQEGRFWIVTYSTADGTKEKSFESEDEARKFYNGLDEVFKPKSSFDDYKIGDNVTVAGKKAKITNMKMDDESGERRARVRFEDGTAEEVSINTLDENTMTTNEGRSAEDIKQGQLDQAYAHLEKIKDKPRLFTSDDIKKAEARIDKLEAELDALAAKSTNESLDEATVRRWQHYAGIK